MDPQMVDTDLLVRKMVQGALPDQRVGDTYAAAVGSFLVMGSINPHDVVLTAYRDLPRDLPPEQAFVRLNALNAGFSGGTHAILSGRDKVFYRYHVVLEKKRPDGGRDFQSCVDEAVAAAERGFQFIVKGE